MNKYKTFRDIQSGVLRPMGRKWVVYNLIHFSSGEKKEKVIDYLRGLRCLLTSHADHLRFSEQKSKFGLDDSFEVNLSFTNETFISLGWGGYFPGFKPVKFNSIVYSGQTPWDEDKLSVLLIVSNDDEAKAKKVSKVLKDRFERMGLSAGNGDFRSIAGRKSLSNDENKKYGPFNYREGMTKEEEVNDLFPLAFFAEKCTEIEGNTYGTFQVFIDFRADVDYYQNNFIPDLTEQIFSGDYSAEQENYAKAVLMGRFPNGTPLVEFPEEQADVTPKGPLMYEQDEKGIKCPYFSHVRAVRSVKEKAKIIRRSVFYQHEKEKGLLFTAYQANVEEQIGPVYSAIDHNRDLLLYRLQPGPGGVMDDRYLFDKKFYKDWGEGKEMVELKIEFKKLIEVKGEAILYLPSLRLLDYLLFGFN